MYRLDRIPTPNIVTIEGEIYTIEIQNSSDLDNLEYKEFINWSHSKLFTFDITDNTGEHFDLQGFAREFTLEINTLSAEDLLIEDIYEQVGIVPFRKSSIISLDYNRIQIPLLIR